MSVPSPNTSSPNTLSPPAVPSTPAAPGFHERGSWWSELSPAGRWGVGSAAALLGLGAIACGVAAGAYVSWRNQGRIAQGVVVQGVAVGNMTPKQAKAVLEEKFGALQVRFQAPEKTYTLGLKQLGGRLQIDRAVQNAFWYGRSKSLPANALAVWKARSEPAILALPLTWDKASLRRQMATVARQYRREAVDARLAFAGGDLMVVPHQRGRAINAGATLKVLQARYRIGSDRIPVTTTVLEPRVAASDLDGRNVLLGQYTTYFDSGLWGRTRNIYIAAAAVDGRVLMPGDRFSFNECTGERTWDKGYRMAHIFENRGNGAEVVDGLAGGVCQVSTTVYNAVRKANQKLPDKVFMRINERNFHSLPVTYVSSGMDATVAWPHKDFKFTNTLTHPVFLRATVSGSRLTVSVYGRVPHGASPFDAPIQLAQAPRTTS